MYGSTWFNLFITVLHLFFTVLHLFFTVLHSMTLSDGKLVFSPFIVPFKLSRFTFCSCVRVCSWLFVHCYVVWRFLFLSCSLFIFCCISSISRSENQLLFIIVLTWLARLWFVVWKLAHSCQISIILFLYPLCIELLLKTVLYTLVSFPSQYFVFTSLVGGVP